MSDLFHRLQIHHASGEMRGERMDIGWLAWASHAPKRQAGRLHFVRERLQFWLAAWRFFGQQHLLIQVDNHYLTATSARICANEEGSVSVFFMQRTSIFRHFLRYGLWRLKSPFHSQLKGTHVHISFSSATAPERPNMLRHCPDALLDGDCAVNLPLHITRANTQ